MAIAGNRGQLLCVVVINDPDKAKPKGNNAGLIKIIACISQEYYVA